MLVFLKKNVWCTQVEHGVGKGSPHKKRLIRNGSPPAQNWDLGFGFEGSLHWRCISPAFLNRWAKPQNVYRLCLSQVQLYGS